MEKINCATSNCEHNIKGGRGRVRQGPRKSGAMCRRRVCVQQQRSLRKRSNRREGHCVCNQMQNLS